MSILDRNLVSEALGEKSITQVARQRHPKLYQETFMT
jgi:hypothetical protein